MMIPVYEQWYLSRLWSKFMSMSVNWGGDGPADAGTHYDVSWHREEQTELSR